MTNFASETFPHEQRVGPVVRRAEEHPARAHELCVQRGHQPRWPDHRVGLRRQHIAVSRFTITAVLFEFKLNLLRNLPTRHSVWDLATGECKGTLKGHTAQVISVAMSPDGKSIVSGSCDETIR